LAGRTSHDEPHPPPLDREPHDPQPPQPDPHDPPGNALRPEALESRELKTIGLLPNLGVIEVKGSVADDKVRVSIQVAPNPLNDMLDIQMTTGNTTEEKMVPLYSVTYKGSCATIRGSRSTAAVVTTR